jgi:hypothetical protein
MGQDDRQLPGLLTWGRWGWGVELLPVRTPPLYRNRREYCTVYTVPKKKKGKGDHARGPFRCDWLLLIRPPSVAQQVPKKP